MTASDFSDWKRHPVTQEVLRQLQSRAAYLTEELVERAASVSQTELAEKAGAIKAMRDMISIEFDDEETL